MTPDDRTPRKRRRRRRRGPGSTGPQSESGNGAPMPGNEAQPSGNFGYAPGQGGQQRRRRRRSRRRGGGGGGDRDRMSLAPETPVPIDIAPGELTAVTGVLYIKPNGAGILVQASNNYVPIPGDPMV